MSTVAQIRILTIQEGQMDTFVAAWKNIILPLRDKYGFHTQAAWIIPERNEFHWILSYSGQRPWEEMDDQVYREFVQSNLELDALGYIERAVHWFIQPVENDFRDTIWGEQT